MTEISELRPCGIDLAARKNSVNCEIIGQYVIYVYANVSKAYGSFKRDIAIVKVFTMKVANHA